MLDRPPTPEAKPPSETPPPRHDAHSASRPNAPSDRERPEKAAAPDDEHPANRTDKPASEEKAAADSKDCKDQSADADDSDVAATPNVADVTATPATSDVTADTTLVAPEMPEIQPIAAVLPAPTIPPTSEPVEEAAVAALGEQTPGTSKTANNPKAGIAIADLKAALKNAGDKSGDDAAPDATATLSTTPTGETRATNLKQLATAVEGHGSAQTEIHALLAAPPRLGPPAPEADNAVAGGTKLHADATQNLGFVLPNHQTNAVTAPSSPPPAAAVPLAGLAVAIAHEAQAGKNRFEIRLDPPELGRIDVRLDIDRDGNVSSRLVVERQDTLDLLRRDATQLERALQQAGLKTADNALEFSLRGQTFGRNPETPQHVAQLTASEDTTVPLEQWHGYGRLLGLGSGVDIRV